VRLAGVELTTASCAERTRIRRGTVSFIFQSFNLFPGLTALENVQFGAGVAGRGAGNLGASSVRRCCRWPRSGQRIYDSGAVCWTVIGARSLSHVVW